MYPARQDPLRHRARRPNSAVRQNSYNHFNFSSLHIIEGWPANFGAGNIAYLYEFLMKFNVFI
jgi:hypothetical protein